MVKEIYDTYKPSSEKPPNKKIEPIENVSVSVDMSDSNMRLNSKQEITELDASKPWSKIIHKPNDPYPYYYFIKLKIPSLNDYEAWKNIIPNLNFDPRSGELIIPSKDEASALALANLISINFTGQLSLENILEKNLIQISIAKAKAHEVVQHKLREQIIENLQGSKFNNPDMNFEKDLVNLNKQDIKNNEPSIEAYTGGDYAYL